MFCSSYCKCHILLRYILMLIFWNTYFLDSKLNRSHRIDAKNEKVNLDVGDMKRGLLLEMQTLIHNKAERSFNEFLLTNVYVLLILDIRPIIRFMLKFFVVHSELNLWHFLLTRLRKIENAISFSSFWSCLFKNTKNASQITKD